MEYKGIVISHNQHEVDRICEIIEHYGIEHFVEIGTYQGGLALYLMDKYPEMWYSGVEVDCSVVSNIVKEQIDNTKHARLYCASCMDKDVSEAIHMQSLRFGLRSMYYCDGGSKSVELHEFAPLTYAGDLLLAHDFTEDGRHITDIGESWGPEVLPRDIDWLRKDSNFIEIIFPDLRTTRIVGFIKITDVI